MSPAQPTFGEKIRSFHDDESGMETLQIVMIAGIAALILLVLLAFWKDIKSWFKNATSKWKSESNNID